LVWQLLPEKLGVSYTWSEEFPAAVILKSTGRYLDFRLGATQVNIAGESAALTRLTKNSFLVHIPVSDQIKSSRPLPVHISSGAHKIDLTINWQEQKLVSPPLLVALKGPGMYFYSFDNPVVNRRMSLDKTYNKLEKSPDLYGTSLKTENSSASHRLVTQLITPFSAARHPLMQFRYKASSLANVTLKLKNNVHVKLSENYPATQVSYSADFLKDQRWHTWTGLISEAFKQGSYSADFFNMRDIHFRSLNRTNQTGVFSWWNMDDLSFGPAVRKGSQLAFTPRYFDYYGIRKISYALLPGLKAYAELNLQETTSVKWMDCIKDSVTVPDIDKLPESVHHLLIKAENMKGKESHVSDIPFLIDRTPLDVKCRINNDNTPRLSNGSTMSLSFNTKGGAAPDYEKLEIKAGEYLCRRASYMSLIKRGKTHEKFLSLQ